MLNKIAIFGLVFGLIFALISVVPASAKSVKDMPEKDLYYGFFTNPNPHLAKAEIYKEGVAEPHIFWLTPFYKNSNSNYGPNVPEKSAFACWLSPGNYRGTITFFGETDEDVIATYKFNFSLTKEIVEQLEGPWLIEFNTDEMK